MEADKTSMFEGLTFEGFKRLAKDNSLSPYEKIGFPDSYREGKEEIILDDIVSKLTNLKMRKQVVLDIGPGCSGLALLLIELCRKQGHTLLLVDSQEMLDHLPDESFTIKIAGSYPDDCRETLERYAGNVSAILTYSVLQYVFVESSIFDFVDHSLGLLSEGGQMLIGDIPNVSKRKRFFSSPNGVRFHQNFTQNRETPSVNFNTIEVRKIDDAVILSLLMRCRAAGYDAYVLPQGAGLPMANRREDILITKP